MPWCARWVVVLVLVGASAARAQVPDAPRLIAPVLRFDVGTLNPGRLDATTMTVGASAGLELGARTLLLARFLRQSLNGNTEADLAHTTHDFVSLVIEQTVGRAAARQVQYAGRAGLGVLFRPPWQAAPVLTLGAGARYPVRSSITLVGSLEVDLADLAGGAYDTLEWDTLLLKYVPVRTRTKLQPNFGLLLAVEWRPAR